MMEEIVILHTNDLHSHFKNWPKMRRYIQQRQKELKKAAIFTLTVDLGDFSDRVHPLTEATDGQANILLMNTVKYDGVTIGNNEGIGNSQKQLNHLYDQANFDVLLANVWDLQTGERPKWAQPFKIIKSPVGTTIGLIGITAPFPLTYNPNGWAIAEVDQVLPQMIVEAKKQADILVLLSHLGIEEETRIAQDYPEIDVVLGSHTHHLFVDGLEVNDCLLAAAGKFGRYIGEVSLKVDRGRVISHKALVQKSSELPEEIGDAEEIAGYLKQGHALLQDRLVACLPVELSANYDSEKTLLEAGLAALKRVAKVEAVLLNNGLFLKTLKAGKVNFDDIHECLPHPMHVIKVTLKGKALKELLGEIAKQEKILCDFPIVGMGFRGTVFGQVGASGLSWDSEGKKGKWLNQPIKNEQSYTFATVDHWLFIPFFPTIQEKGYIEFLFPDFLRTVFASYLGEYYPCD